jgi:hypothetical protein
MHTLGVVFYIASMWIAGVMQGLMWRATNPDGTLTYSFVEALNATYPTTWCASAAAAGAVRHVPDGAEHLEDLRHREGSRPQPVLARMTQPA